MSEGEKDKRVPIYVDGQEVLVAPGTNLVEAAALAGKEVPHYCYHPKLSVVGNCRMCLIEMGTPGRDRATGEPLLNDDGSPKIMWVPRPVIGCATTASPGMHVRTDSPIVKECREGVMEFLLVNHPLDCPICDQAGECRLQEFATDYGRGYSRFIEEKNVKPKRTRIGPRVMLDDERCILCSRCIRFTEEFAEEPVLGFTDRGSYTTLTTFPGKELAHNYSLNTVDICPVGALTSTDFRFKMRVWFLKETDSIDTESSVGCNTVVGSREGKIHRITPRRNDLVNDTWMPDSGRALYKMTEGDDRVLNYAIDGKPCSPDEAFSLAATLLNNPDVAIVGSGRLSLEEQFLLTRIRARIPGPTPSYLVARTGQGDGKLLSADRNPNVRGALLTGLIEDLPAKELTPLGRLVNEGTVRTILVVGEDLSAAGLTRDQLKRVSVIYIGSHHNETSSLAKIEIPLLTVFEKAGTFVNQQFRVQKFAQAIPGPKGVLFGLSNFTRLLALLPGGETLAPGVSAAWEQMAREVPELEGWTFGGISSTGRVVSDARFAHLPFIETAGLHFEPKSAVAAEA
ncbi:MAG: (2Fe-2S)-binding protein [Opitutales bacterium]|nr:(2Fe-2S)-binding protein [Opitutales bacterium]